MDKKTKDIKQYRKDYYKNNKSRQMEMVKKWRDENPEKVKLAVKKMADAGYYKNYRKVNKRKLNRDSRIYNKLPAVKDKKNLLNRTRVACLNAMKLKHKDEYNEICRVIKLGSSHKNGNG